MKEEILNILRQFFNDGENYYKETQDTFVTIDGNFKLSELVDKIESYVKNLSRS